LDLFPLDGGGPHAEIGRRGGQFYFQGMARTQRLVGAAGNFISRGICPERFGRQAYGKLDDKLSQVVL